MVEAARRTPAVKARVAKAGMRVISRSGRDMGFAVFSSQFSVLGFGFLVGV